MKKFLISIGCIAGIIVATGLAFGGLMATKTEPEKREAEIQKTLVEVVSVKKQPVFFDVTTQGTVTPRTETVLYPEVSGQIIDVSPSLYAGGIFEKGEVLLRIDPSNYEAAVISAEANLARMQVAYAQEKALSEQALKDWVALGKNAESAPALALREPQLKEAEADIRSAEAALARAQRDLRKTVIVAPYEGMVKKRFADLGQVVSQGTQLAQVFAIDFVEIRLPLTADDIQFIDLPFAFRGEDNPDAYPRVLFSSRFGEMSETWMGRIVRIEGTIDPKSRVMYAVARVEDPYGKHRSDGGMPMSVGMFVEASVEGKSYEQLVVVPRYALKADSKVLIVDENDELHRREVNVLRTDGKWAYLQDGVDKDERVCLTALEFVVEGMPVEPVESKDRSVAYFSRGQTRYSSL